MIRLVLFAVTFGSAITGAVALDYGSSLSGGMVRISKGHAVLGAADRNSLPGPSVFSFEAFEIDRREVSNADYSKFVETAGHPPAAFSDDDEFNDPGLPVTGVTWDDANAYCQWSGKRLPSEIEWEASARGADGRLYPWGNVFDAKKAHLRGEVPIKIKNYPATDTNPIGMHGLAGGVSEWVSDIQIVSGGVCGQDLEAIKEASEGTSLTVPKLFSEKANLGTYSQVCATPELLTPEVTASHLRLSLKLIEHDNPLWGMKRCAYLKGNSFNGVDHMTKLTNRMWDYTDTIAEFVGFRCARSVN